MLPFLPDVAHAMAPGGGDAGQSIMGLLPLVAMFAIFYFLLIRPQQKRAKEHKAMIEGLRRGDEVVTSGGIHGKVTGVTDDVVTLEIAPNVKIRVQKPAVGNVLKRGSE
ncbi:MAG: preprotein translocase subunit YajC [Thermodesulfobacteriota bacterium]